MTNCNSIANEPKPDDQEPRFRHPVIVFECMPGDSLVEMNSKIEELLRSSIDPLIVSLCGPTTVLTDPIQISALTDKSISDESSTGKVLNGSGSRPNNFGNFAPPATADSDGLRDANSSKASTPTGSASNCVYGERMVIRILSLLQAVGAATIFAPSLAESRHDRFAIALAVVEAVRRFSQDCVLLFYGVEHPASALDGPHTASESPIEPSPVTAAAIWPCIDPKAGSVQTRDSLPPFCDLLPIQGLTDPSHWPGGTITATCSLVSIIVRSAGRNELLIALDSIAGQTYDSIEVVVVDVLGTDCLSLADTCGRFPLRTVCANRHLPRAEAANVGLDAVSTDCAFITFLDDDDWLLPDHVQLLYDAVTTGAEARAAYTGVLCLEPLANGGFKQVYKFNEPYDATRLLLENYLPIHAVLFDRTLLSEKLRFDETLDLYEDWDFWIQLSQLTPIIHIDRFTSVYRITAESGFGVHSDNPEIESGRRIVVDKWRQQWTDDQVMDIVEYARFRPSFKFAKRSGFAGKESLDDSVNQSLIRNKDHPVDETCQVVAHEKEQSVGLALEQRNSDASFDCELGDHAIASEASAKTRTQPTSNISLMGDVEISQGTRQDPQSSVESCTLALSKAIDGTHGIQSELRSLNRILATQMARIEDSPKQSTSKTTSAPNYDRNLQELHREIAQLRHEILDIRQMLDALSIGVTVSSTQTENQVTAHQTPSSDATSQPALDQQTSAASERTAQIEAKLAAPIVLVSRKSWQSIRAVLRQTAIASLYRSIRFRREARMLEASGLIDTSWYQTEYPDVRSAGISPALHFVQHGWQEGRRPNPLFDTAWYLTNYPDVKAASVNPLTHYFKFGANEGRLPNPLFDTCWYLLQNPDVKDAGINPLVHYLHHGGRENRAPHPLFDAVRYSEANPELVSAGINPLAHYLRYGTSTALSPHHLFDPVWYKSYYFDEAMSGMSLLVHFLERGAQLGYRPNPDFDTNWYREQNQLNQGDKINPLIHYALFGRYQGLATALNTLSVPETEGLKPGLKPEKELLYQESGLPSVLIIDSIWPQPDRDSGSMDMMHTIDNFHDLGFRVLFAADAEFDVHNTYKVDLLSMGILCVSSMNCTSIAAFIDKYGATIDVFFLSRVHSGGKYYEIVCRFAGAARMIFNTVDLHFLREAREAALRKDRVMGFFAAETQEREIYLTRQADATIVVAQQDKLQLEALVPGARLYEMPLIRACVESVPKFEERSGIGFIGSYNHPPNIDAVHYLTSHIWPLIRARIPNCKLYLAGSGLPEDVCSELPEDVEYLGYVRDLDAWFSSIRVVVAPLRYGAGAKGKVASSLAHGVPCVATPIAAEGMRLTEGLQLSIANDPQSFADSVAEIYVDADVWQHYSASGLRFAQSQLSKKAGLRRYACMLQDLGVLPHSADGQVSETAPTL